MNHLRARLLIMAVLRDYFRLQRGLFCQMVNELTEYTLPLSGRDDELFEKMYHSVLTATKPPRTPLGLYRKWKKRNPRNDLKVFMELQKIHIKKTILGLVLRFDPHCTEVNRQPSIKMSEYTRKILMELKCTVCRRGWIRESKLLPEITISQTRDPVHQELYRCSLDGVNHCGEVLCNRHFLDQGCRGCQDGVCGLHFNKKECHLCCSVMWLCRKCRYGRHRCKGCGGGVILCNNIKNGKKVPCRRLAKKCKKCDILGVWCRGCKSGIRVCRECKLYND